MRQVIHLYAEESSLLPASVSVNKMHSSPDSEWESKKRSVTCGLGEWAWDLTRGWSVGTGPGRFVWSKRIHDQSSSALRSPPARFKCSGAGSESVESEAEAEEEMFLQVNQLEEERGLSLCQGGDDTDGKKGMKGGKA